MSFMSWLPSALKELLSHVPTLLFEVVAWKELTKDISTLSARLLTGAGAEDLRKKTAKQLPNALSFSSQTQPTELNKKLGETILELYFRQLHFKEGMFLDLRAKNFSKDEAGFSWNPSSMWASFTPDFIKALDNLYDGFYLSNEDFFHQGLVKTGLISESWNEEDQTEMKRLFKAHFGSAIENPMEFKLSAFQESFQNVFSFLMEKKVKLSTDFLISGVMLVTLYLSLEEIGGEYEVANIYKRSKQTL